MSQPAEDVSGSPGAVAAPTTAAASSQSDRIVALRRGVLVSLRTAVSGGIVYDRRDLNTPDIDGEVSIRKIEKWETTKITEDPQEFEKATATRNAASAMIRRHCLDTAFGLLCPMDDLEKLNAAIDEAKALVKTFNLASKRSQVNVWVMVGLIMDSDERALRAIASEVRNLVGTMRDGVSNADVERIREAAKEAKRLQTMLTGDVADKASAAIQSALKAARTLTKRVVKEGEKLSEVIQEIDLKALDEAQFAFLELVPEEVTVLTSDAVAPQMDFPEVELPEPPSAAVAPSSDNEAQAGVPEKTDEA